MKTWNSDSFLFKRTCFNCLHNPEAAKRLGINGPFWEVVKDREAMVPNCWEYTKCGKDRGEGCLKTTWETLKKCAEILGKPIKNEWYCAPNMEEKDNIRGVVGVTKLFCSHCDKRQHRYQ